MANTDATRQASPELAEAYRRGANITNAGLGPIASLSDQERQAKLAWALDQALNGFTQAQIAAQIGIHQTSLSQAFLKYCEDDWKEVQVARAWAELEDARDAFASPELTPDMTAIARARERVKSAQWQLERLHRRLFGTDAPPQAGQGVVQININLGGNAGNDNVIQHEPPAISGDSK